MFDDLQRIFVSVKRCKKFRKLGCRLGGIRVTHSCRVKMEVALHHLRLTQARSQVLKFGGAKYIFRGARFLFSSYFYNKLSGNKKIWGGTKEIWGVNDPVATGLV